jgi:Na+-transporting methylmalonyl-CoA/oxaloacetate decarboxylase gamma subunit
MLSLGDSFEYTNSIVGFALQIANDAPEFYVFMYLIVIAWIYVVLMMSVAEATNSNGTLLGALVTFVLYGLGPVALVVYLMGAPARSKAIKKRAAEELQQTAEAPAADAQEPPKG